VTLLTKVKEQIVPITIVAVIIAVGYFTFTRMPPRGSPWDIAEWILLLVTFCTLFSLFPAVAIIYGWRTGNRIGAFLVGVLALPLVFIFGFILLRPGNMVFLLSPIHSPLSLFLRQSAGLRDIVQHRGREITLRYQ